MANLVDAFGDQFRFRIVCGDRDYTDEYPYTNVESDAWNRLGKAEVLYLSQSMRTYASIKRIINQEKPSVVYINGLFSRVFSIFPLRASNRLNCRAVIAPRGMLAPAALGIKSRKKKVFLRLANAIGLYDKVVFHATHSHEVSHIRTAIPAATKIVEIPNVPKMQLQSEKRSKKKGYLQVLVIARIAPEKNIGYALQCLSKLPTHLQIDVDFVGPVYDQAYFEMCKALQSNIPANVKIAWEGAKTPADIASYFRKSHLFFLPTLGENFGHAILESLLSGVPVLISDQTPWHNLEQAQFGRDIPLADMQAFVDFITEIAEMSSTVYEDLYLDLSQRAIDLVDMPKLEAGYKKLFG